MADTEKNLEALEAEAVVASANPQVRMLLKRMLYS